MVTRNSIEIPWHIHQGPLVRLYDKFVSQTGMLASERMKKYRSLSASEPQDGV